MIYVVLLEDDDSRAGERTKHMQEHLAFLEGNAAGIDSAGPLKDAGTGKPAGGLWLVRADNAQEVRALVEADPFWPTGLRKSVRILEWNQVFADGRRRI